ncbi:SCA7-domain-containing protein [Lichtheimia hyalospora FSU 10163]|nr:SCA7-domain-containing protein [Lichtheimia hyalospora FSU 10163]
MSGKATSKRKESLTEEQQDIIQQKRLEIDRLQKDINSLAKPLLKTPDKSTSDWSKHVTPGTLSVFQEDTSWHRLDTNSEHKLGKHTIPFQRNSTTSPWQHMQNMLDSFDEDHEESLSEGSPSPTVSRFDTNDQKIYGTNAMEEDSVVVKCKTCERPILASSFQAHSETCGKAGKGNKKPRALTQLSTNDKSKLGKEIFSDDDDDDDDDDDGDDEPLAKRQMDGQHKKKHTKHSDVSDTTPIPAKRPPTSAEKPEKKKSKKKETKPKGPKPKPPLDLDKQCGVIQGPNNTPCTRSLTCKSHSMGAKRAVAGRSQPYDVLLSAYQKKAIGRPQTTGAGAGDRKGGTSTSKSSKASTKKSQKQIGPTTQTCPSSTDTAAQEEQYINSDEELENVMHAVTESRPAPLAERPFYFVKRRRQCYRLRDILLDAITPKAVSMVHSDSNNTLASLYNNNSNTMSPTSHTSATARSPLQQSRGHYSSPSFPTSSYPNTNISTSAPTSRFAQQNSTSAAGGLAGSPLSMMGLSGSMDTGAMFSSATSNSALQ